MLLMYRGLLQLYPAAYRREFMEEMLWVCEQAQKDLIGQPFTARVAFYARELAGLLAGAAHERLATILEVDFRPVRSRDVKPQYRFPRSTIGLMLLILAGVLFAIEQAKGIQVKYSAGGHATAVWSTLPRFASWALALVSIAGFAGWSILFALGRSGVQRLSKLPTGVVPEIKHSGP
jgi:hypothetical protein